MLDRPMCLTFAINILVAMGTVTWRIPQLYQEGRSGTRDSSYLKKINYISKSVDIVATNWVGW